MNTQHETIPGSAADLNQLGLYEVAAAQADIDLAHITPPVGTTCGLWDTTLTATAGPRHSSGKPTARPKKQPLDKKGSAPALGGKSRGASEGNSRRRLAVAAHGEPGQPTKFVGTAGAAEGRRCLQRGGT
jgi:hypothetical protein